MSSSPKLYVDSCCFIELIKFKRKVALGHDEKSRNERENDCWFLRQLSNASRDRKLRLATSMLTVAECTHIGEEPGPSVETKLLFEEFLTSGVAVDLIEPDIFVAEQARDLRWDHDIRLAGADAMHVASALLERCDEFLTWDGKISKKGMFDAIPKLKKLGLNVLVPSKTQHLSLEYRQGDFYEAGEKE